MNYEINKRQIMSFKKNNFIVSTKVILKLHIYITAKKNMNFFQMTWSIKLFKIFEVRTFPCFL